jgi:ribose 5-phosphate isomerase A
LKPKEAWVEEAKRKAALEAIRHVKDCFIVGLGSGSTAAYAIEALGERIRRENLNIMGVPTSYQSFLLAVKHRIAVTTLEEHPTIDLAREKIVASASKQNIIIADESKKVKVLGENNHPVPIEVLPFAISLVKRGIEGIGGKPVLREGKGKVGPVITDNGNAIIDASFGLIEKPAVLEKRLKLITGVVETGLFVGLADLTYIGTRSAVEKIERKRK